MTGFVLRRFVARVVLFAVAAAAIVALYRTGTTLTDDLFAMLVHGDLGESVSQGGSVVALILEASPVTAVVTGAATILSLVIGLPLGIAAGVWRSTVIDAVIAGLARIGAGTLHLWLGTLLVLLFALTLRLLPPGGFVPFAENPAAAVRALILPVLALALPLAAALALRMRNALGAAQDADFVLAARAQGMSRRQAVRRYGVRAAMPIVLDGLGRHFAVLAAAAIVIETVFFLPGIGRMTLSAVTDGDLVLLRGGLLAMLAMTTMAAVIGDLVRALMGGRPKVAPDTEIEAPRPGFGFWFGLLVVIGLCGLSVAAQFWSPFPLGTSSDIVAPSLTLPLGTDSASRDMFLAVMAGLGTGIIIALLAVAIGVTLGVPIGLATGVAGGPLATAIIGLGDAVTALPVLIVAIALFAVVSANAVNTTLLLGLVFVPPVVRVVHLAVRRRLGRGSIAAARLAGLSRWSAASRHVFPELRRTIAAKAMALIASGMLAETVLSFIGLGVQAPTASIGLMLADAQAMFLQFPHLAIIPGAVLLAFVVAVSLVADALNPDPALRGADHAIA